MSENRVKSRPLHETCFLQREKRTPLFHRLQAPRRDVDGDFFAELGNEKGLALEVDLTAARTCRVEFGSTNTVGIAASHPGTSFCNWANLGHKIRLQVLSFR